MSIRRTIDIDLWNRREHFLFFSAFTEPFYGIVAEVDVSVAYRHCRDGQKSFFLWYLHRSLLAVNTLEPFRLRIGDGSVVEYDAIHASATISREDGTFGFSFINFDQDFDAFSAHAHAEITRIRSCTDLLPPVNGQDAVHYSSLPWIRFTSLSHARHYTSGDSAPKISFGRVIEENGRFLMPCSVHVHHALVDGKDVGDYFRVFQELLDNCQSFTL